MKTLMLSMAMALAFAVPVSAQRANETCRQLVSHLSVETPVLFTNEVSNTYGISYDMYVRGTYVGWYYCYDEGDVLYTIYFDYEGNRVREWIIPTNRIGYGI